MFSQPGSAVPVSSHSRTAGFFFRPATNLTGAWSSHQADADITPAVPNTRGNPSAAYSAASPPMDDPAIAVCSRPGRVG